MKKIDVQFDMLAKVSPESWKKLAKRKIYFAHQSVGYNIIDGMKELMRENPDIQLNIVESANGADFVKGIFAHSQIGQNTNPKSKTNQFVEYLNNGIVNAADVVALKYCYVDFRNNTIIENIFSEYVAAVRQIKEKNPDLKVIHFTVPLTTIRSSWKTTIKKIMGKDVIWEFDDNVRRNEYNELILNKFQGKDAIFDIAKIESTYPDGTRVSFVRKNQEYYSLAPEYTDDGSHLNKLGRKLVAAEFLSLLIELD